MNMRKLIGVICLSGVLVISVWMTGNAAKDQRMIRINVLLNTSVTDGILADLGTHGKLLDVIYQINAVILQARAKELSVIQELPYVAAANPDARRLGAPIDTVSAEDFVDGLSTWNLDAVNITNPGFDNRQVDYDGMGVYVAVLDSGLVDTWRQYFPEQRIASEYGKSFGGSGAYGVGKISEQPNKWEHDTNSHGTHVTSTILGYSFYGTPISGVAPMATVIPVKVLNKSGWGWSSIIARGIVYIANLKAGPLNDYPVVINMSLGGPLLDAVEEAAVDYAISEGVIIVAAAGNGGSSGMSYPGAYEPVISVAAAGWVGQWTHPSWWWFLDVTDPTNPDDFYIVDISSRELSGQDLDVVAPGGWVVGPYQLQMGKTSYYYLVGTSMAAPHVAGIVALMAQKNPALTAAEAESILESSAIYLGPGSRTVYEPWGTWETYSWGADATGWGLVVADAALAATPNSP